MSDLLLEIESVADMDLERAAAVGRAYDADPELRPLRVGGDPARVRVEGSLEELIRRTGLPIDWLTVRTNSRRDGFEGGEIVLRTGRGGFIGWPQDDGGYRYHLTPHKVTAGYLRTWTDAGPGRLDRVASLFARLCEAIDACYGIATVLPRSRSLPPSDVGLGQVGWLNYFGPAFLERWPGLAVTGAHTEAVANGGVTIRIAPDPWHLKDVHRQPVMSVLGEDAFERNYGPNTARGIRVPSYEDHMRYAPGTEEMPWVAWERDHSEAKVRRSRERRHANARKRRLAAQEAIDPMTVAKDAEWSASFDADDWRSFGRRLFRGLGGDLHGPFGKALLEEIASAPVQSEESVDVATRTGPVEVRWFIDDIDTVDIYVLGPKGLPALVDAEHERWAEA